MVSFVRFSRAALIAAPLLAACGGGSDEPAAGPPDAGSVVDGGGPDSVVPPTKTWTIEKTPVDVTLWDIWGSGPNDVYAVGNDGTILHSTGDGEWVKLSVESAAPLVQVSGSGPDDVYVAGVFSCEPQGCNSDGTGWIEGGFYHSQGDLGWSRILPDYPDGFGVRMIGRDEGYFMGTKGTGDVLLHLMGPDNWVPEQLPLDHVGPHGVWSSSREDVYLLGQGNLVFHSTGDGNWTLQDNQLNEVFSRIWGSGPNDIYITAQTSLILHSTGDGTWSPQQVPPILGTPGGVWGSGPNDVYVVTGDFFGTTGEILHSDGSGEWTLVDGAAPALYAVWGSGPGDVYAAGAHGVILHLK